MRHHQPTPNPTRRRRWRRTGCAIGALALSAAGLVAGSGPAGADQTCRVSTDSVVCLNITPVSGGYHVHVGIDVSMNPADVQPILSDRRIAAYVEGEDEFFDDDLFVMGPTWLAANGQAGISAEFDRNVTAGALDEDWGMDEIYVDVSLYFPRLRQYHSYRSNTWYQFF